ncbi:YmdB family metallophosphoesterase [Candidatus Dojkabacteria bacterium]|nr:YmdB family metallophosphoesterase [Candidatus Dojkabacteria bacterium]
MIRVLFIGDVCGKPGRRAVRDLLPEIKAKEKIDVVITNIENSAHGRGATVETVNELMYYGVDFMTAGNHIWRRPDFHDLLSGDFPIIRGLNYPDDLPGKGFGEIDLGKKGKLLVITVIGYGFMNERTISEPFRRMEQLMKQINPDDYAGILTEMHAESTSEKVSFGLYFDGKVSAVLGTHTHIPTADERLLPSHSAYITDVGMVGPLDSSLWVKKEIVFQQNMYPYSPRYEIEEEGPVRFDAVVIEIDGPTSAKSIKRINKTL